MKRRNRQVYRELEARSRLLDEMTRYVEPLLERLEAAELKLKVITLENTKLQRAFRAQGLTVLDLLEQRNELSLDNARLLSELHESPFPEDVLADGESWGIDIGGEG